MWAISIPNWRWIFSALAGPDQPQSASQHLKRFYYQHQVVHPSWSRSACLIAKRRPHYDSACSVAVLQLEQLLDQLEVSEARSLFERKSNCLAVIHAGLFRELRRMPQLARVVLRTITSLFRSAACKIRGSRRKRKERPQTEHWRWRAPAFLRQACRVAAKPCAIPMGKSLRRDAKKAKNTRS